MFVILDLLGRTGLDPKICAGRKLDGANRGSEYNIHMSEYWDLTCTAACLTTQCKGFRYAVCTYCQRDLSHLCGWVRSPIPAPPASAWRSRGAITAKEMEDMAAADMDSDADDMVEVGTGQCGLGHCFCFSFCTGYTGRVWEPHARGGECPG